MDNSTSASTLASLQGLSISSLCFSTKQGRVLPDDSCQQVPIHLSEPLLEPSNEWPNAISDQLRCQAIKSSPKQLKSTDMTDGGFPLSDFCNGTKRWFSSAYCFQSLDNGCKVERDWLVCSPLRDSLCCFCCKLLNNVGVSSFPNSGRLKDWKHLFGSSGSLHIRETSSNPLSDCFTWKELEASLKSNVAVDKDMHRQLHVEEQQCHQVLQFLLDLMRGLLDLMRKNSVALRGSSDKAFTERSGAFLQIVPKVDKML